MYVLFSIRMVSLFVVVVVDCMYSLDALQLVSAIAAMAKIQLNFIFCRCGGRLYVLLRRSTARQCYSRYGENTTQLHFFFSELDRSTSCHSHTPNVATL